MTKIDNIIINVKGDKNSCINSARNTILFIEAANNLRVIPFNILRRGNVGYRMVCAILQKLSLLW
jgi:hypothetical protein